jgi:hypothetical protein
LNNIHYATKYKNKVINLLLKNKNLIKLINPVIPKSDEIDIIDVLRGGEWTICGKKYKEQGYIFDHDFTDSTTTSHKTFIFVETDIKDIEKDLFTGFTLYICLFTSKELVRITDNTSPTINEVKNMGCYTGTIANRIDVLGEIIDKTINGNEKIKGIGNVKPSTVGYWKRYSPNTKYYGRCLAYTVTNLCEDDFNECGN